MAVLIERLLAELVAELDTLELCRTLVPCGNPVPHLRRSRILAERLADAIHAELAELAAAHDAGRAAGHGAAGGQLRDATATQGSPEEEP